MSSPCWTIGDRVVGSRIRRLIEASRHIVDHRCATQHHYTAIMQQQISAAAASIDLDCRCQMVHAEDPSKKMTTGAALLMVANAPPETLITLPSAGHHRGPNSRT
jgi:hypothetical protein